MLRALKILLCSLLVVLGCQSPSSEQIQTFQNAQSAFDEENYRKSAELYEELIKKGSLSGNIYFNLGNAWAKADEPVRAIAAYYHAKRYIPNDPHLEANFRAVLASNQGTLPQSERTFIGLFFFWQDTIGYNTKIVFSLVITGLSFFGGVIYLFCQSKWLRRCLLCCAAISVIALSSVGYDWYRFERVERVIVTAEVLPRKGNSEQYEPAFVSPIPFGASAVILDDRNGWFLLRFSGGQEGWVSQSQTFRL